MLSLLVGLGVGVVLGAVIGWLFAARKSPLPLPPQADSQPLIDELRSRMSQSQTELVAIRAQLTDAQTRSAGAEAERDAAKQLVETQRELNERAMREAKEAQAKALSDLRETFRA